MAFVNHARAGAAEVLKRPAGCQAGAMKSARPVFSSWIRSRYCASARVMNKMDLLGRRRIEGRCPRDGKFSGRAKFEAARCTAARRRREVEAAHGAGASRIAKYIERPWPPQNRRLGAPPRRRTEEFGISSIVFDGPNAQPADGVQRRPPALTPSSHRRELSGINRDDGAGQRQRRHQQPSENFARCRTRTTGRHERRPRQGPRVARERAARPGCAGEACDPAGRPHGARRLAGIDGLRCARRPGGTRPPPPALTIILQQPFADPAHAGAAGCHRPAPIRPQSPRRQRGPMLAAAIVPRRRHGQAAAARRRCGGSTVSPSSLSRKRRRRQRLLDRCAGEPEVRLRRTRRRSRPSRRSRHSREYRTGRRAAWSFYIAATSSKRAHRRRARARGPRRHLRAAPGALRGAARRRV